MEKIGCDWHLATAHRVWVDFATAARLCPAGCDDGQLSPSCTERRAKNASSSE